MFFNIWFILFCEITDKWGEALSLLSLATSLSKKPLRSVLYCPLKTHLVLFLALGALFGFCIVNQTSSFESFVTLQWRRVETHPHSFLIVGLRVFTAWVWERFVKANVFLDHTEYTFLPIRQPYWIDSIKGVLWDAQGALAQYLLALFRQKRELQCIFLRKKASMITSKHGTTTFFSHYNLFLGKLQEKLARKARVNTKRVYRIVLTPPVHSIILLKSN